MPKYEVLLHFGTLSFTFDTDEEENKELFESENDDPNDPDIVHDVLRELIDENGYSNLTSEEPQIEHIEVLVKK